jgi:hypothetical protein
MPYQGIFTPRHPQKYVGNAANIVYRSSWERRFFDYCDSTPGVLRWASEELIIPYRHPIDGRVHRYFPDVWLETQTPTGPRVFLVEIKPKAQTEVRTVKRKTRKFLREAAIVAVNHAKWDAAKAYCADRNWTFLVLTEEHLFRGFH